MHGMSEYKLLLSHFQTVKLYEWINSLNLDMWWIFAFFIILRKLGWKHQQVYFGQFEIPWCLSLSVVCSIATFLHYRDQNLGNYFVTYLEEIFYANITIRQKTVYVLLTQVVIMKERTWTCFKLLLKLFFLEIEPSRTKRSPRYLLHSQSRNNRPCNVFQKDT